MLVDGLKWWFEIVEEQGVYRVVMRHRVNGQHLPLSKRCFDSFEEARAFAELAAAYERYARAQLSDAANLDLFVSLDSAERALLRAARKSEETETGQLAASCETAGLG